MGEGQAVAVIVDDRETFVVHRGAFGKRNYLAAAGAAGAALILIAAGLLGDHSTSPTQALRAAATRQASPVELAAGTAPAPATASVTSPKPTSAAIETPALPDAPALEPSPSLSPLPIVPGAATVAPDPTRVRLTLMPDGADLSTLTSQGSRLIFVMIAPDGSRSIASLEITGFGSVTPIWTVPACHWITSLAARGERIVFSETTGGLYPEASCPATSSKTWRVWILDGKARAPRLAASGSLRDSLAVPAGSGPVVALGATAFAYSVPTTSEPASQVIEVRATGDDRLLWTSTAPGEVIRLMLAGSRLGATVACEYPGSRTTGVVGRSVSVSAGDLGRVRAIRERRSPTLGSTSGTGDTRLTELGWADAGHRDLRIVAQSTGGQAMAVDGSSLAWLDAVSGEIRLAGLDSGIQWTALSITAAQDTGAPVLPRYLSGLAVGSALDGPFFVWVTGFDTTSFLTFGQPGLQLSAYRPGGQIIWLSVESNLVVWVAVDDTGVFAGAVDVAALRAPSY